MAKRKAKGRATTKAKTKKSPAARTKPKYGGFCPETRAAIKSMFGHDVKP